jgi:predicted transcriptional regulator
MKPRVGVYLSDGMAARLSEAAKHPRATKSALVEAALDRFLGSDDAIDDTATVAHHLAGLSRQLEQFDRNLRIANETGCSSRALPSCCDPANAGGRAGSCLRAWGRTIRRICRASRKARRSRSTPHPGDDRRRAADWCGTADQAGTARSPLIGIKLSPRSPAAVD